MTEHTVSVFSRIDKPRVASAYTGNWEAFATRLKDPLPRTIQKDDLPLWALAQFREGYRNEDNVHSITAWTADVDVEPVPTSSELRAVLTGLRFVAYSSSSASAQAPRWRVSIELSRPVDAQEYRRLARYVESQLPFGVGNASHDPSRWWCFPREGAEGYFEHVSLEGVPIDVDEILRLAPEVAAPVVKSTNTTAVAAPSPDAAVAIGPDHPEYADRLAWFRRLCRTCRPPEHGGQTFAIAARGTREAELPIPVVAETMREELWPRCANPVPSEEWHKVERVVARSASAREVAVGTMSGGQLAWALECNAFALPSAVPDANATRMGGLLSALGLLGERLSDGTREARCPCGQMGRVSVRGRYRCADRSCGYRSQKDFYAFVAAIVKGQNK